MTDIIIGDFDHDQISQEVRIRLASRLENLLNRMEIFIDDDPREFSASQLTVYLQAVRIMGSLYQAFARPVDQAGFIPAERVERMLEAARIEAAALAVTSERERVALESRLALESARSGVRDRLALERARISGD